MKETTNSIHQGNTEPPYPVWQSNAHPSLHSQRNITLTDLTAQPVCSSFKISTRIHTIPASTSWTSLKQNSCAAHLTMYFLPTMTKTTFICFQRIPWDSVMQHRTYCLFEVHTKGSAQLLFFPFAESSLTTELWHRFENPSTSQNNSTCGKTSSIGKTNLGCCLEFVFPCSLYSNLF